MISDQQHSPHQWAASSIDAPHATLDALQNGLTVDLIATKRADFATCVEDEPLATVVRRTRPKQFDFLPVVEAATAKAGSSGRIIGLIEIEHCLKVVANTEIVGTVMHRLSDANLIGANASILAFVRDDDRQRCRLIVSGHQISGLVSISDLQRLPVRAALFGLVTDLEITMANAIRQNFNGTDAWLERLAPGRREKLKTEIDNSSFHDGFVDALLFTQFCDKVTIIRKSPRFAARATGFEGEMKKVQTLRDHLAHANDYAATPDAASRVCATVRLIEKWRNELRAQA